MSGVPNVFGSATSSIPLSQLDVNFNTPLYIGNTSVGLGNTVTSFGNVTLTNVTVSSTNGDANIHGVTVGLGNSSVSTNTVVGTNALQANTSGVTNTAIGNSALQANTTASNNTAVGYQAGYSVTTTGATGYNTFIGQQAGYACTSDINTFIGAGAGGQIIGGRSNTILGRYSGNQGNLNITASNNYIVLSDGDGNPRASCNSNGTWNFGGSGNYVLANTNNNTLNINFNGASYNGIDIDDPSGTSGCRFIGFSLSSGNPLIGSIQRATSTNAVLYNTTSDYRLKSNPTLIQDALSIVSRLNPVSFTWTNGNVVDNGFLAHELQSVIPNCVTGEKDAVDKDNNPIYQQVDTSGVIPFLTKAIQELFATVTTQATEIAALKAKVGI